MIGACEAFALAEVQYQARIAACAELGHGPYDPQIDPQEFSADVYVERTMRAYEDLLV